MKSLRNLIQTPAENFLIVEKSKSNDIYFWTGATQNDVDIMNESECKEYIVLFDCHSPKYEFLKIQHDKYCMIKIRKKIIIILVKEFEFPPDLSKNSKLLLILIRKNKSHEHCMNLIRMNVCGSIDELMNKVKRVYEYITDVIGNIVIIHYDSRHPML